MTEYPFPIEELEKTIGYKFNNNLILKTALTHSSYANEQRSHGKKTKCEHNERLEFLGDSVLSLITSEYLYEKFKDSPEGYLTKVRAAVVCSKSLASLARAINLGSYLLLGRGEEDTGRNNQKILENAFEALLAAIYLDSGHSKEVVAKFLIPLMADAIEEASRNKINRDYKTALQQFVQANGRERLEYNHVRESGPDHDKTFEVEVMLNSNVIGKGIGKTWKEAEQEAAKQACILFDIKWDI
ncbi:MAG: ribonuclease III [Clostridia bacterium]|nr:ribonuclease III [Clostridia bacterium]